MFALGGVALLMVPVVFTELADPSRPCVAREVAAHLQNALPQGTGVLDICETCFRSFFSAANLLSRLAIKKSKSSRPITRFSPSNKSWISGIAMPLTEKAATIITTPGAVCQGMVSRIKGTHNAASSLRSVRVPRGFAATARSVRRHGRLRAVLGRRQRRAAGAMDCVEVPGKRRSARFLQPRWIGVARSTLATVSSVKASRRVLSLVGPRLIASALQPLASPRCVFLRGSTGLFVRLIGVAGS